MNDDTIEMQTYGRFKGILHTKTVLEKNEEKIFYYQIKNYYKVKLISIEYDIEITEKEYIKGLNIDW